MMTNAQLRKQARRLYGEHHNFFWSFYAIVVVCNLVWNLTDRYLIPDNTLRIVLSILYHLVLTPFMVFGVYHVMLSLLSGEKLPFSQVFVFYRSPHKPDNVIMASLLMNGFSILITLTGLVPISDTLSPTQALILLAVFLFAVIIILWLSLRLFLFPILFVKDSNQGFWTQAKHSFAHMKRKTKRLLWYGITAYLPMILVYIFIIWVFFQYYFNSARSMDIYLILYPFQAFIGLFLYPYIDLSLIGYADQLLKANENQTGHPQQSLPDEQ